MGRACKFALFVSLILLCQLALAAEYGDTVQYFPQAIAGGGAVTAFSIHNPGTADCRVRIQLMDSDGIQFYSSEELIDHGGIKTVSVGVGMSAMKVGWARLSALSGGFEATEFFQLTVGGQALPRVGVLPCATSASLKFFAFLVKGQTNTGIAVANPSEKTANITLRRYNALGAPQGEATATLQSGHHLARFLNEAPWFPGLDNFEGIVELTSTEPVALVMLRSDNALLSSAAVLSPSFAGLSPGSITTDALADGAVTAPKIGNGAVTGAKIADGSITGDDLASDSVTMSKLDATGAGAAGQVLGTDGSRLRWQDDSFKVPLFLQSASPEPALWLRRPTGGNVLQVQSGTSGMYRSDSVLAVESGAGAIGLTVDSYNAPAIVGYGIQNVGVQGIGQDGVWGVSEANDGVFGHSESGFGVHGIAASGTGVIGYAETGDGVFGRTAGESRCAVCGFADKASSQAGFFAGSVTVTGVLTKGGGAFKIDHPLDPENRYLSHSFVESPDMKNVYDGIARLGEMGEAWVELPDWFEALNRDFRYQLTSLDVPGGGLYVATRISGNRFKIGGGTPGQEVSWQVTGIRQDAFANANRIPVEELKPASERGAYMHPEAWGQAPDRGVYWSVEKDRERLALKPDLETVRAVRARSRAKTEGK